MRGGGGGARAIKPKNWRDGIRALDIYHTIGVCTSKYLYFVTSHL